MYKQKKFINIYMPLLSTNIANIDFLKLFSNKHVPDPNFYPNCY